jgi:hypothetical protein
LGAVEPYARQKSNGSWAPPDDFHLRRETRIAPMKHTLKNRSHGAVPISIAFGALIMATQAHALTPVRVRPDTETTIAGFGVACTGIGETKTEPRWRDYPVRVEFADALHDYLAGEVVTLSPAKGDAMVSIRCNGPWLLLKPPDKETYRLSAQLTERNTEPQGALLKSPDLGQARIVLTFPRGY